MSQNLGHSTNPSLNLGKEDALNKLGLGMPTAHFTYEATKTQKGQGICSVSRETK